MDKKLTGEEHTVTWDISEFTDEELISEITPAEKNRAEGGEIIMKKIAYTEEEIVKMLSDDLKFVIDFVVNKDVYEEDYYDIVENVITLVVDKYRGKSEVYQLANDRDGEWGVQFYLEGITKEELVDISEKLVYIGIWDSGGLGHDDGLYGVKLIMDNGEAISLNDYIENVEDNEVEGSKKKGDDEYKSDEDIRKEFENFEVKELKFKESGVSGYINIYFPNAGESVGGGTSEVVDNFIIYDNGKIAFDNWYPEEVYLALVNYIYKEKGKIFSTKGGSKKLARTNRDVIEMFLTDSFPKDERTSWGTTNLKIEKDEYTGNWGIKNYLTWILYYASDGSIYFNTDRYSVTTSKIQNQIRYVASDIGVVLNEVGEKELMVVMDSDYEQVAVSEKEASKKEAQELYVDMEGAGEEEDITGFSPIDLEVMKLVDMNEEDLASKLNISLEAVDKLQEIVYEEYF